MISPGANINAQTEETQETALTLACCGGFSEVADFLIKAGADIELGCSTPLMEASQEGHLELVKYLLAAGMWLLKRLLEKEFYIAFITLTINSIFFISTKVEKQLHNLTLVLGFLISKNVLKKKKFYKVVNVCLVMVRLPIDLLFPLNDL